MPKFLSPLRSRLNQFSIWLVPLRSYENWRFATYDLTPLQVIIIVASDSKNEQDKAYPEDNTENGYTYDI